MVTETETDRQRETQRQTQREGWTNGGTDKRTDGQTDGWTDREDRHTDRQRLNDGDIKKRNTFDCRTIKSKASFGLQLKVFLSHWFSFRDGIVFPIDMTSNTKSLSHSSPDRWKQLKLTWCFFIKFCTAVRELPRSVDSAMGFLSCIQDSSSSTSLKNWYMCRASSRLSLRMWHGSARELYLQHHQLSVAFPCSVFACVCLSG